MRLAAFAMAGRCPSAAVLAELEALNPESCTDAELVEAIRAWQAFAGRVQVGLWEAVTAFTTRRPPALDEGDPGAEWDRSVSAYATAEIAAALNLPLSSADRVAGEARAMQQCYPRLVASLKGGKLTWSRFCLLTRALADVHPEVQEAITDAVLPDAEGTVSNGSLRNRVRRAVLKADPGAAARRAEHAARTDTCLVLYPREDAMAALVATAPAVELVGVHAAIDAFAKALKDAGATGKLSRLRVRSLQELVLTHPAITGLPAWQAALHAGTTCPTNPHGANGSTSCPTTPHGTNGSTSCLTDPQGATASTSCPTDPQSATGSNGTADVNGLGVPGSTTVSGVSQEQLQQIAALAVSTGAQEGSQGAAFRDHTPPADPPEADHHGWPSGWQDDWSAQAPWPPEPPLGEVDPRDTSRWVDPAPPTDDRSSLLPDDTWSDEQPLDPGLAPALHHLSGLAQLGGLDGDGRLALGLPLDAIPTLGCGSAGRFASLTLVAVPYDVLLGASEAPGELAGYGPIPAPLARAIAADPTGTWQRLVTDPLTGSLQDFGTTRYRPPAKLTGHVITRDWTCRAPGCTTPATVCDLDHTTPYRTTTPRDNGLGPRMRPGRAHETGTTCAENLVPLCRRHHRAKTFTNWTLTREPNGTIHWSAPTGHTYTTHPDGPIQRTGPAA